MTGNLTLIFILAATVVTGLLAGVGLDKSLVQLPARHRIGVVAFAAFSHANDLGNGLILYPALGIGAALLTILAALTAMLRGIPFEHAGPHLHSRRGPKHVESSPTYQRRSKTDRDIQSVC